MNVLLADQLQEGLCKAFAQVHWIEVNASPTRDSLSVVLPRHYLSPAGGGRSQLAHKQIAQMARHDVLTGLPDRLFFRECFDKALEPRRSKAKVAVLCLDLDSSKVVNKNAPPRA